MWRFVQVIEASTIGGAERHTWLLSRALARLGHPVTFIAPPGPFWAHLADLVPRTNVTTIIEPRLRDAPWKAARVLQEIAGADAWETVIHSHLLRADFVTALTRSLLSCRFTLLSTIHARFGTELPWSEQPIKRALYYLPARWALSRMDIVFAVSNATARQTEADLNLPRGSVLPLRNGVELADLLPATRVARNDPRPIVVSVGRLEPRKGQDVLLRAIARLAPAERPHVRLVGTGPGLHRLQDLVGFLHLEKDVDFLGAVSDVPRVLKEADLYVQASVADPLPRALLEAMALAVPCVASAIDGIPEVIQHARTGWLFSPGDDSALSEAIRHALTHPGEARVCAELGQQLVRTEYTMERMARDILSALDSRVSPRHR